MSTKRTRPKSTREAILDAAVQLFLERSPSDAHEVRLLDIARKAGVSRRSIYVHFGSRASLLVAMLQHFDAAGVLDGLVQRVLDAPTASEALDAVAHLHAEYSPVAYPIASVVMTARHADDALRAAWDDRMAARRELYMVVVRRLADDGLLDSAWTAESATDVVWTLSSWQVWEQLVVERGWSKEQYREHLGAVLRRSLVAEQREGEVGSGPR